MTRFVAYYRDATDPQEWGGCTLVSQHSVVAAFVADRGGELASELTEVENSGGTDRPQLLQAFGLCRRENAILVIAKLDRLARDVAFITLLMESGVEFVAADNPHATKLLLHMLAALAKHEKHRISARTKVALAAAKARGVKLGNPNPAPAAALGRMVLAAKEKSAREQALPIIQRLRTEGVSLRRIVEALNAEGVPPLRGKVWHPETVRKFLTVPEAVPAPSATTMRHGSII